MGAATLKPREANVVRTRGTDSRLVFAERRERGENTGAYSGGEGYGGHSPTTQQRNFRAIFFINFWRIFVFFCAQFPE